MAKTLTVDINFLLQPASGQGFSYKINKNGATIQSVGKAFVDQETTVIQKIVKVNTDFTINNENFKSFNGNVNKIVRREDGKYVVVGSFTSYDGQMTNRIVILNGDGSVFQLFPYGSNGIIHDLKIQSDNKMLIGGNFSTFNGYTVNNFTRVNSDGSLDTVFNDNLRNAVSNKGFNSTVYAIFIQGSGHIIVGGAFSTVNNNNKKGVVRLNSNGTVDIGFNTGTGVTGTVYALEQGDSNIYVGGYISSYSGVPIGNIVAINGITGVRDDTFNSTTGFNNVVRSLKHTLVTKTGGAIVPVLLAGGDFTTYKGNTANRIIMLNPITANQDNSFIYTTGFDNSVLTIDVNNKLNATAIYIGGAFNTYKGNVSGKFVEVNQVGTFQKTINFDNSIRTIAPYNTGDSICLGGDFSALTIDSTPISSLYTIPLGANMNDTKANTYDNLVSFNPLMDIVYTNEVDRVRVVYTFNDEDIVTITDISDSPKQVEISFVNTSSTVTNLIQELLVRSSHILKAETEEDFDTALFEFKVFEGNLLDASSYPVTYNKTKQKITDTQNNVWVNISNLIKEGLESNVLAYTDNDVSSIKPLPSGESKWVKINIDNKLLRNTVDSSYKYFFILDGYIKPQDFQGIKNILMSGRRRIINRGSIARIYFKTVNLQFIEYYFGTITNASEEAHIINSIPVVTDVLDNTQYVQSLRVDTNTDENKVTYVFDYGEFGKETVTFNIIDECKYDNFDLVFKNKYGILETIPMSKKSSRSITTDSKDYIRSIVNLEGDFDISRHTNKQYNVSGVEEWVLNSDFMPEYMNNSFEEAQLSEEMWIIDSQNQIFPIVKTTDVIEFKTKLNDKLIQYTIKVKLSHKTPKYII